VRDFNAEKPAAPREEPSAATRAEARRSSRALPGVPDPGCAGAGAIRRRGPA
jgi:hypothetical protein